MPATGNCILKLWNLIPDERYVVALAAYTKDGKIIGGAIGETASPIPASHPLPLMTAWAYVSQV